MNKSEVAVGRPSSRDRATMMARASRLKASTDTVAGRFRQERHQFVKRLQG
jgi:hypothetical protein